MGLLVGLGVIARFPLPGGGGGGAFLGRGGVNSTAKNLVALKRRRIRAPGPKSSGKPQQNRGADELKRTWRKITVEFPGIFPLARIQAREEIGRAHV